MNYDLALSITRLCLVVSGATITLTLTVGLLYTVGEVLIAAWKRAYKKENRK
jgi:hypothetical protein